MLRDASTPAYRMVWNLGAGTAAQSRSNSEIGSMSTATVPSENGFFSTMRTRSSGPATTSSRAAAAPDTKFSELAERFGARHDPSRTCIDPRELDASFAGRTFDAELLAALPDDVDPCGPARPQSGEKVVGGVEKVVTRRETSRDVSVVLQNARETAVSRRLATLYADLGSTVERREGSSPSPCTEKPARFRIERHAVDFLPFHFRVGAGVDFPTILTAGCANAVDSLDKLKR